jgi:hypothetical protein
MSTSALTAAEWLDLLIAKAPALREAGVLEVSLAGGSVKLAEFIPPPQDASKDAVTAPGDAMDDAITYGGVLPGFPRLHGARDDGLPEGYDS